MIFSKRRLLYLASSQSVHTINQYYILILDYMLISNDLLIVFLLMLQTVVNFAVYFKHEVPG